MHGDTKFPQESAATKFVGCVLTSRAPIQEFFHRNIVRRAAGFVVFLLRDLETRALDDSLDGFEVFGSDV